jgi:hypothetical protein
MRPRRKIAQAFDLNGAGGGTRTPKPLRTVDFESTASTNSATPATFIYNDLQLLPVFNRWNCTQNCTQHRGPTIPPAPVSLVYIH